MRSNRPILIIDDNEDDVTIMKKALNDAGVLNEAIHVSNGLEALDYLTDQKRIKPQLIILELKLSIMSGREFLIERLNHPDLMIIPVVVLTALKDPEAKYESFKRNIAGFMHKPADYTQMVEIMTAINQYWSYSEVTYGE